jgi:SOS response regulatory protein OraA/RecX
MEQYTKVIFDAETQTESIIPMTEEEIADLEKGRQEAEENFQMQIKYQEEKAKNKLSASDKLLNLGFTVDEISEIINIY